MAGHRLGDCFLIPSGGKHHLFTIVLGPKPLDGCGPSDQVIVVSVTTLRPDARHDPTCILQAGEHPFITHESYVYYRQPEVYTVDEVDKRVATMGWQGKEPCSPELYAKISDGLRRSKMVPNYIKELLK